MPRRQRGWKCLVLLAMATPMANGKSSECKGNQILEMIEAYAPECIEACEEVCQPLGGLIMSVFAGEMDAATLICPDWKTFSCMAKTPLVLSHCTPLLDAALVYVGIDLPRSDQELRQLCGITSTVTVTSTLLPPLPPESPEDPEVVPEPDPVEPPEPPEAPEPATAATAGSEAGSEAGSAGSGAEAAGTGENSLSVQSVAEPFTPADAPNITNTSTSTATTTLYVTETETSTVTATVTETHTVTESTTVTASTTTLAPFGTVDTVLDHASSLSAPWLLLASCIWIWR